MAKLFYSLEEAAAKLKVSPEALKEKALLDEGLLRQRKAVPQGTEESSNTIHSDKLHVFRDHDRLMFQVEQIDLIAWDKCLKGEIENEGIAYTAEQAAEKLGVSKQEVIELSEKVCLRVSLLTGKKGDELLFRASDINLIAADPSLMHQEPIGLSGPASPREEIGISIFDADATDESDPSAVTRNQSFSGFSPSGIMDLSADAGSHSGPQFTGISIFSAVDEEEQQIPLAPGEKTPAPTPTAKADEKRTQLTQL